MNNKKLIEQINNLKKEKDAVILVHNYQRPEIYEVADFLGDSFELARAAAQTEAKVIVFCGVDFMAQTAKILNPKRTVLHPELAAQCMMSRMVDLNLLREMKKKYPNAAVVSYVNTNAETKAESDICCTSANAVKIVNALKEKEVIFLPDKNLAAYVQSNTTKKIIPWNGFCYVHQEISADNVKKAKQNKKNAKVLVHPECRQEVVKLADAVCSTSQMLSYAKESNAKEFIIVTEEGMINRLKKEIPNKIFYGIGGTCVQMKRITLQSVLDSLKSGRYEVIVEEKTRKKAEKALRKMLEVGK
ncbi:MAG: quinolinate synthase NadA [archaeon]